VSLAVRLYQAGMPKSLVIEAFRKSVLNATPFIDELYASSYADEELIARCVAAEAGLMFDYIPPDVRVVVPSGPDFVALPRIRHSIVLASDKSTLIYVVLAMPDVIAIKNNITRGLNSAERLRVTTPSRLAEFLRTSHETFLAQEAIDMVERAGAEASARTIVTGRQGAILGSLLSCCLFAAILFPAFFWQGVHGLFSVSFSGAILLRIFAFIALRRSGSAALPDRSAGVLPVYTVMIALYGEAEVVPQLVTAMKALDWPHSKLEVLFLCEADDIATIAAFEDERLRSSFRVIPVPGIGPRTKPKALNYGLQLMKGDFVVVYDAEDRPHPQQLMEAWQRFAEGEEKLGCLQAPLIIANPGEGWLARLFAFEYAAHFRGMLPWMAKGKFVLPLGGSSNHFRRTCLDSVGGWDPFNVTEDAELGARLARYGFQVEMLTMPTLEDAPTGFGVWLRQRTRWLKGGMQTWLIEMRRPLLLLKQLGARRFVVYHLWSTGMIISTLLYPFMLIFILYSVFCLANAVAFRPNFLLLDMFNIPMGFLAFHALGRLALKPEKLPGPVLAWVPLYWLMISIAAWRALWQLHTAPFLWEKTPHQPAAPPGVR
jgi:cellulose synthase/poly-beta-1,6-N-acetylglucosamine synthase-like glycosyltransferase